MLREYDRQLQQTLWDLQKRYGDRVIDTLAHSARPRAISTGFLALDTALSRNGIPCGRLTALMAASSSTSGLTTLAYYIVAQAQREAPAVYLDLSSTLDADYAAHCGVALDRLLIVRGVDLVQALSLTRDVVSAGTPSLIVIDPAALDHAPPPTQFATLLRRIMEPLTKSRCAVLFLLPTPTRLFQAVNEAADTAFSLDRRDWQRRGRDIVGYSVEVTVLKDRERSGERCVSLDLPLYRALDGDSL